MKKSKFKIKGRVGTDDTTFFKRGEIVSGTVGRDGWLKTGGIEVAPTHFIEL